MDEPEGFNPKTHVLRRRGGKLIAVDKQILRWRKANKRAGRHKGHPKKVLKMRNIFK